MMCKKTLNIHNQHKVLEKEKINILMLDRIYTCTTTGLKFLQPFPHAIITIFKTKNGNAKLSKKC